MEEKENHSYQNSGTIHQFNTGAHATLIYHGTETPVENQPYPLPPEADLSACSDAEQALAIYITDATRRAYVVKQLRQVVTAHDIAFRVVAALEDLPTIDARVVVKERFIQPLIDLAVNVSQGRSVNNVREQVNQMVHLYKWKK